MQAFPLQHKKMQRLALPYLRVGTCEVMNTSPFCMMDSFHAFNTKNTAAYNALVRNASTTLSSAPVPQMGQLVAGGLVDSYTGGAVSRFFADYLSRAMSIHTIEPAHMRELRREYPDDPLIDIMLAATQRHRAMHQLPHLSKSATPHTRTGKANGAAAVASLRSVLSDADMQQYAVSADAAFFKACSILMESDAGAAGAFNDDRSPQARQKLSAYEKRVAESLAKAIEAAVESSPAPAGGTGTFSAEALRAVCDSGCRAVWFAATVAPSALELQRRLALGQELPSAAGAPSSGGMAPPARKSLSEPGELMREEMAALEDVVREHPFCLDVMVSNVGDARAFGIARNRHTAGTRSLLDPTRERVVPLSIDHRPFRQEEFHRIVRAGGKVESTAGEVIDGNPFFNVSRSFGHQCMKNDPRRSPVQQKLSALPHCASWRMLPGDVLVLANHAIFETRHEEDSSMDEVARLVGREVDRKAEPEQAAAAVCDFAMRFGAPHSLQVMVAVATRPDEADRTGASQTKASKEAAPCFDEWIEPGPLYVEACRQLPALRDAFRRDCARCGVSPAEMVGRRWERVREVLPLRHALPLMPFYGRECGALQQVMDEEAIFFDQDTLRHADAARQAQDGTRPAPPAAEVTESFERLARSLLGAKRQ